MSLGQRIYDYRTQKQLSQAALAELLNVSRQSISKWETDTSVPELDKLIKMGELFEVSLDVLIKGETPAGTSKPMISKDELCEEAMDVTADYNQEARTETSSYISANSPFAQINDFRKDAATNEKITQTVQTKDGKKKIKWNELTIPEVLAVIGFSLGIIGTIIAIMAFPPAVFFTSTLFVVSTCYLATAKHPFLKAGWILWVVFYLFLRFSAIIRPVFIFYLWLYRPEASVYIVIAWTEMITLLLLSGLTIKYYRKPFIAFLQSINCNTKHNKNT